MKEFNGNKFCNDLLMLRGQETQQIFAQKLDINRSSLSLLESGKQLPSLDILNKVCNLGGFQANDYFQDVNNDSLIYLMGILDENDRNKVNAMAERIRIKEKYDMLARRRINDTN